MLWLKLAIGLFCATATLSAQDIPAGTALPVTLNSTLDAKKDRPGEKIEARLMQDVPLPSGGKIKSGSHVIGHVVEVTKPASGGSRIVLKFDQLEDEGKAIPLSVSARAIAASDSTYNAQIPIDAESNYESSDEWVMRQVGGDIVNRGRGVIASGDTIVGKWKGAAWAKLAYVSGCPPRDVPNDEQAMWVFSVGACGLYGFRDIKLVNAGDGSPIGQIVLESQQDLHVGDGSGWLLIVSAAPLATR
jgi:hypothetical protein